MALTITAECPTCHQKFPMQAIGEPHLHGTNDGYQVVIEVDAFDFDFHKASHGIEVQP